MRYHTTKISVYSVFTILKQFVSLYKAAYAYVPPFSSARVYEGMLCIR